MTNVPNEIREMWADVYRLFDANYNMLNTEFCWNQFWKQAEEIKKKYNHPKLVDLIVTVSEMIELHMKKPCALEDMELF